MNGGVMANVTLGELVVLMYHLQLSGLVADIDFEDAEFSLEETIRHFNRTTKINKRLLESALWSCNLMDESDLFWEPGRGSFKTFAQKIARCNGSKFNFKYNLLEEKDEK